MKLDIDVRNVANIINEKVLEIFHKHSLALYLMTWRMTAQTVGFQVSGQFHHSDCPEVTLCC